MFEDRPRGDVNAERLDNCLDVLECVPDRVAIKRVSRHLIEVRCPHGFKSDAAAGANDEDFGHALSYLVLA